MQSAIDVIAGVRDSSRIKFASSVPTLQFDVTTDDPGFTSMLSEQMISRGVTDVICTLGFSPTFIPETDRRLAEQVDYLGTLKLIAAAEVLLLNAEVRNGGSGYSPFEVGGATSQQGKFTLLNQLLTIVRFQSATACRSRNGRVSDRTDPH